MSSSKSIGFLKQALAIACAVLAQGSLFSESYQSKYSEDVYEVIGTQELEKEKKEAKNGFILGGSITHNGLFQI